MLEISFIFFFTTKHTTIVPTLWMLYFILIHKGKRSGAAILSMLLRCTLYIDSKRVSILEQQFCEYQQVYLSISISTYNRNSNGESIQQETILQLHTQRYAHANQIAVEYIVHWRVHWLCKGQLKGSSEVKFSFVIIPFSNKVSPYESGDLFETPSLAPWCRLYLTCLKPQTKSAQFKHT